MAAPTRLFTAAFVALSVAELAYFTAAGLLIPITPLFAAEALGADTVGVGMAVGAFSVTALVLRPISGRLSDRRGRRPLLIGGALLCAAAIAAHTLVPNLAVLLGLRLVLGVAEAFFFVAGFAMVADLAPLGRAGEALSFNSLALFLGIAFGPSIGEILLAAGGFTLAWIGGAGLALAAGLLALTLSETGTRQVDLGPMPLIHRRAALPSLGLFTGVAGVAGFLGFLALYVDDLGMEGTGPVLLLFGLTVVVTRIPFAKLPDRVPPFRLAAAALAMIGIGLFVVALTQSVGGLFIGTAVMAVGVAFTTPAFFAAIIQRVAPSERGVALGTTSVFLDLAFGGGPMALGFVAAAGGIPSAYAVAGLVAGLGAVGTAYAALTTRPTCTGPAPQAQ